MTRWQDLGEVLDSDDESEHHSPEPVRKRRRIGTDSPIVLQQAIQTARKDCDRHDDLSNEDAIWLHHSVGRFDRVHSQGAKHYASDDLDTFTVTSKHLGEPGGLEIAQGDGCLIDREHAYVRSSPLSDNSGDLPNIRDLLANRDQLLDLTSGTALHASSSELSSPLSEREFSLSPPPFLRREQSEVDSAFDGRPRRVTDRYGKVQSPPVGALVHTEESTLAGGRRLRHRQEKQLHPYVFDRLQYQQQWRDHGLKPIRIVEDEREANGTRHNTDHKSRSPSLFSGYSPARSDDSPVVVPSAQQASYRRREDTHTTTHLSFSRLQHTCDPASAAGQQPDHLQESTGDTGSVPLSPPPTSSDRAQGPERRTRNVFRMPPGLSPAPLPTPLMSSTPRRRLPVVDSSDSELSHPGSRASNVVRNRQPSTVAKSPSESEASEAEFELDERRLQREKRRIKGVLPASWLKIDFRAQQRRNLPSPAKRHERVAPSPGASAPQKGVARRVVVRRSKSPSDRVPAIEISDDDGSDSNGPETTSRLQQTQLRDEQIQTRALANTLPDDDRMEVDRIDSMLARHGQRSTTKRQTKARQPRITEAFDTSLHQRDELLKEQRQSKQALVFSSKLNKPKRRSNVSRTSRRPPSVRLSVVDTPELASSQRSSLPQFFRLALRRARARSDLGRHSPARKYIRLATDVDTEDAISTLQNWRDGAMVPRTTAHHDEKRGTVVRDNHFKDGGDFSPASRRVPLSELPTNQQRPVCGPVRTVSVKNMSSHRTPRFSAPREILQQSRLQPFMLPPPCITPPRDDDLEQMSPAKGGKMRGFGRHPTNARQAHHRRAQLESSEIVFHREHRNQIFERGMLCLTENITRPQKTNAGIAFQLERYLDAQELDGSGNSQQQSISADMQREDSDKPGMRTMLASNPRVRKRQSRRVDVDVRMYRQPSEPLPEVDEFPTYTEEANTPEGERVLEGLGSSGTRYAIDFDVVPLSLGTFFRNTSFIGSGDLAASLDFAGRNLDQPTGRIDIRFHDSVLELGMWTEDAAEGLRQVPGFISSLLDPLDRATDASDGPTLLLLNVDYLLRSTIRYFSRCVAFSDPIDRQPCVATLQSIVEDLLDLDCGPDASLSKRRDVVSRCLLYTVVLAHQASRLCDHPCVPSEDKNRSVILLQKASSSLAVHALSGRPQALRAFHEDNKRSAKREAGIDDNDSIVCAVTVLHHILKTTGDPNLTFWGTVQSVLMPEACKVSNVAALDGVWYNIFSILPILEIGAEGVLKIGSRFHETLQDWSIIRRLIQIVLESYQATCGIHGLLINDYVRALFRRCGVLITRWGWTRCDTALNLLFDFFTVRGLTNLLKEESRGSPSFLQELDRNPSIETQLDDRSFHIFLKVVVAGLTGLRQHNVYSDKKIGSFAWRLIPNHGRTFPRDAAIAAQDLDALRNHHDLLCTLYYASPPSFRPRVQLFRNLVDHATSHREACRLNIRAWANLASFQASLTEDVTHLEPFVEWFKDVLATSISQYRLARVEVEHDAALVRAQETTAVTQKLMDGVISRNQRGIAATISDALAALKRAISSASSLEIATCLLSGSEFWRSFDLFDPCNRRVSGVFDEALEVIRTASRIQCKFRNSLDAQGSGEDSQDYGDLDALHQLASTQGPTSRIPSIDDILHAPLACLMSNAFGADMPADDGTLTKVVDTWVILASSMVQEEKRTWSSYINDYSSEAWSQLRDTNQKQKFTPYFLAKVVELGTVDLEESGILTVWLCSLVERDVRLKFQHVLTTALLNGYEEEPLLHNLPFSRSSATGFVVQLHDIRQRRLALISSILANMHRYVEKVRDEQPHRLQALRKTYADMLRQFMTAMKLHYQDLQTGSNSRLASVAAQGAYTTFVQRVVAFLQQYASDICQIDHFFTDSAAFPLPATDPTYVVGRLKGYSSKLGESNNRKALVCLLLALGERAAVDGQQKYLVDQLATAMNDGLESGDIRRPTLRHVLTTAAFPTYIEDALSTGCSWILALPVFRACGRVVKDLLYSVKFEDSQSLKTGNEIIETLLKSMVRPAEYALASADLSLSPRIQVILMAIFDFVRSCLTYINCVGRTAQESCRLSSMAASFVLCASVVEDKFKDASSSLAFDAEFDRCDAPCNWPETKAFARSHILGKLSTEWTIAAGQCYLSRGKTHVQVVGDLGDEEETREQLLDAARLLRTSYATVRSRGRYENADIASLAAVVV